MKGFKKRRHPVKEHDLSSYLSSRYFPECVGRETTPWCTGWALVATWNKCRSQRRLNVMFCVECLYVHNCRQMFDLFIHFYWWHILFYSPFHEHNVNMFCKTVVLSYVQCVLKVHRYVVWLWLHMKEVPVQNHWHWLNSYVTNPKVN